jgi:hypothetical protein
MDKGLKFTEEELYLKKFRKTEFYQTVAYRKLQDVIIDRGCRLSPAAAYLGEDWRHVRPFLSAEQKNNLETLSKKYGRNGGRKRLRFVGTTKYNERNVGENGFPKSS